MQTSRFHWHWFQTNWTRHFSPRYSNGIKVGTAFKRIFEEIVSKLSVNFGNRNSQDSHKNWYPNPVLNFGFTEPKYSDKCCSNLPLKCHIFTIGNTHSRSARSPDLCFSGFVWNQLPRVGIITWLNDVITVPAYTVKCVVSSWFTMECANII